MGRCRAGTILSCIGHGVRSHLHVDEVGKSTTRLREADLIHRAVPSEPLCQRRLGRHTYMLAGVGRYTTPE